MKIGAKNILTILTLLQYDKYISKDNTFCAFNALIYKSLCYSSELCSEL